MKPLDYTVDTLRIITVLQPVHVFHYMYLLLNRVIKSSWLLAKIIVYFFFKLINNSKAHKV